MSSALEATNYIYEGVWTNWSRGNSMLGSTLTLRPQNAVILTSALTIFITITGTQLWYLCKFALHQSRATTQKRNLLYHQSQSVLRNTSMDVDALKQLLRLSVAWRRHRDARTIKTLVPLMLLAFLHLVLVVVVGIFSSSLLNAGTQVLSISPWCGNFDSAYFKAVRSVTYRSNSSIVMLGQEFTDHAASRAVAAQRLVDTCDSDQQSCSDVSLQRIEFTRKFVSDTCPVNQTVCHPDALGSMVFDTGFISSHDHLGYNSPESDRLYVRLQAQCAPLRADGYVTGWQNVSISTFDQYRQLCDARYGVSNTNDRNATATITKREATCDETFARSSYNLIPYNAFPGADGQIQAGSFQPIQELYPIASDLSLVMLAFQTVFGEPVIDPWFSAETPISLPNSTCLFPNVQPYSRRHPLTAMACTQQWQLCTSHGVGTKKSNANCTDPAGLYQLASTLSSKSPSIVLNLRQKAIWKRLQSTMGFSSFYYQVLALSQSSSVPLKVKNLVQAHGHPRLPSDYWRTEVTYWTELVVSYFQRSNLDYSTGQFAASTSYINVSKPASRQRPNPSQDTDYWLCQNQIIRSEVYRNYNFFGLCLLAVLGFIIILLGWFIEDITGCWRTRSFRHRTVHKKQDMWNFNSDLTMLRLIDELQRGTRWSVSKNGIPLAPAGYDLSATDLMSNGVYLDLNRLGKSPYVHQNLNSCGTCTKFGRSAESSAQNFELSTSSITTDGQQTFVYEHDIPTSREPFLRPSRGLLVT